MKTFTITAAKRTPLGFILKFCFAVFILGNIFSQIFSQTTAKSVIFTKSCQSAELEQGSSQGLLEYISTSDDNPVSAQLRAVDGAGKIPSWLTVNGKILNGIRYTTGSEITFDFYAANLSIGTYHATVTASATGYNNGVLDIKLRVTRRSSDTLTNFKVNFQEPATVTSLSWLCDYGEPFRLQKSLDKGYSCAFGGVKRSDRTALNLTKDGRKATSPFRYYFCYFYRYARELPGFL